MKKTYISPAALTVQLGTVQMMAESLDINLSGTGSTEDTITGSEQILTKESRDINLWDNEW
ncbi:MAG: hypothetical protein IJ537_01985 [Bacteroidaceae bacterium]|nr:hypothetical protein [Bacteroidaceae bacterium]MBQ9261478.1 hypothetical protein [Prevotella sp.]